MNVTIRRALPEDADTVGAITACSWQEAYKGIVPYDYLIKITPELRAERYRAASSLLPDVEFYLVKMEDEPAGVMNLHRSRDEDTKDCGEIGVFYFLPEYWGKGPAAEAMAFILDRAKEIGYQAVILWVMEENLRARRFYEKQRFALDGGRKVKVLGKDLAVVRYRKIFT